jgi:hypothetical protein
MRRRGKSRNRNPERKMSARTIRVFTNVLKVCFSDEKLLSKIDQKEVAAIYAARITLP